MGQVKIKNLSALFSSTRRMFPRMDQRGMTIVEVFIVLLIIAALAAIAIPAYVDFKNKARSAGTASELRSIEKIIYAFSIDNGGSYPTGLDQLNLGATKDPWGNDYGYYNIIRNGTGGARTDHVQTLNSDFDLYCVGANGQTDEYIGDPRAQDDILRAGDGGFMGMGNAYMAAD